MGKGDIKTKKGKIRSGSYGVSRRKADNKKVIIPAEKPAKKSEVKAETKPTPAKAKAKAPAKKAPKKADG